MDSELMWSWILFLFITYGCFAWSWILVTWENYKEDRAKKENNAK